MLCIFEQLYKLKINTHKIELFFFGQAKNDEEHYGNLLGCESGSFPSIYLVIPIHFVNSKMVNENQSRTISRRS
jgi:hypothetical protein